MSDESSKRIGQDFDRALEAVVSAMGSPVSDMENDLQAKRDLQAGVVRDTQGNIIPPPPKFVTEEELGPPRRVNDLDMLVFLEKWGKPDAKFGEIKEAFEALINQASRFAWSVGRKQLAEKALGSMVNSGNQYNTELLNMRLKIEAAQSVLEPAAKP